MANNDERQVPAWKSAKLAALLADIKAENEQKCAERNARRWKEERDPVAYEKQKEEQRAAYAAKKGEPVRSYKPLTGATKAERAEETRQRAAAREKDRYANSSPEQRKAKSEAANKRRFFTLRREKGLAEEEIERAWLEHVQKRKTKTTKEDEMAKMQSLPTWGMF